MANRWAVAAVLALIGGIATAAEQREVGGAPAPAAVPPPPVDTTAAASGGAPRGRPQSCVPLRDVGQIKPVGDRTLLIRAGVGRYWRSDLQQRCAGLLRTRAAIEQRVSTGMLCSGDLFTVFDPNGGIALDSCLYGRFTPVTLPPGQRF